MNSFQTALSAYQQKNLPFAQQICESILQANENELNALNLLGVIYNKQGQPLRALPYLNKVFSLVGPRYDVFLNLGLTHKKLYEYRKSLPFFEQAMALEPQKLQPIFEAALAHKELRNFDEAKGLFEEVLKKDCHHTKSWCNLAGLYNYFNKSTQALDVVSEGLKHNPDDPSLELMKGDIYRSLGQKKEAAEVYRRFGNYSGLSLLGNKYLTEQDVEAIEADISEGSGSYWRYVTYHFALFRFYDELGSKEKAFKHLQKGNDLHFESAINAWEKDERFMQNLPDVFTPEYMDKLKKAGDATEAPIFILGMPRSGTSLVEQILSSHKSVEGAGELMALSDAISEMEEGRDRLEFLSALKPYTLKRLAKKYMQKAQPFLQEEALYFTDKMPANFIYVALIRLMFPRAKIIHCTREPLDTCFSCYKSLFSSALYFTFNLELLSQYFNAYEKVMSYWEKLLGEGLYEVNYESMVSNFEEEVKSLLVYCDLPWDENCLKFYENKRTVKTVSVQQVRQDIYTSSVAAWKKYEDWLSPLKENLS